MKVKVSQVLDNAGYLYPRYEYELIRTDGEMVLLETDSGARRWVHESFILSTDGSRYDARTK